MTNRQTDSIQVLCKKIRSKSAILKKFSTCTPVNTKRTNRVASKNHTSGINKNCFLSDLISRGLRGTLTKKSDQNSEKKFSVLAGLTHFRPYGHQHKVKTEQQIFIGHPLDPITGVHVCHMLIMLDESK